MLKLIPYRSSFLDSFIQWRGQPLSVRHNPLKAMSNEDIARMLEAEGSDLSELSKLCLIFGYLVEVLPSGCKVKGSR
jgi:hypothetical protein